MGGYNQYRTSLPLFLPHFFPAPGWALHICSQGYVLFISFCLSFLIYSHRIKAMLSLEGTSSYHLAHPSQLRQGKLEHSAQDLVYVDFKPFHGWRLHSLSGQPLPGFAQSHS